MIPEELNIKGFYSYQNEQRIFFDTLLQDGIFGIFGNVGSGKSSILEAMTLALYKETERLSKGDNRNYNLMNLKSNELKIDFVFRANNKRYKFQVTGKRNARNREKVESLKYAQFVYENNDWLSIEEDAQKILGLSYENFRRTIIIPQGKFQEFLTLGAKDRTDMMKELFSLHQFDLSEKTNKHFQNVNTNFQTIQGQLAEIGNPTQEELDSLERNLQKIESQIQNLQVKQNTLQTKIQEQESLQTSLQIIQNTEKKLQELNSQSEKIKSLEEELLEWDIYKEKFFEKHLTYKSTKEQISQVEEVLKDSQKKLTILKESEEKIRLEFEKKEKRMKQKEFYYQRRTEWIALKDLLASQVELKEKEKKLESTKQETSFLDKKILELKEELKTPKQNLLELREKQNQLTELLSRKAALTEKLANLKKYHELENEIQTLTKEFQMKRTQLEEKAKNLYHLARDVSLFEQNILEIKKEIQTLEKEIENFQVLSSLQILSKELQVGDVCPLCGETIQSKTHIEQNLQKQNETQNLKTKLENLKAIHEKLQLLQKESELEDKNYSTQIQNINLKLQNLEKNLPTKEEEAEFESLEPKIQVLQNSKAELLKLEKEVQKKEKAIEDLQQNLEKKRELYSKASSELSNLEGKIQNLRAQISQEVFDKGSQFSLKKIKQRIELQTSILDKIPEEYQKALETKNQFEKDFSNLENLIHVKSKEKETLSSDAQRLESELKNLFSENPKFHFDKLNELSTKNLNSSLLREQIQKHYQEIESCKSILKLEKEKISKIPNELENLDKMKLELQETLQNLNQSLKEKGSLETNIKQLRDSLARKKELEEKRNFLQNKLHRIETLKNLFKAQGFVNYISRIFLEDLCESANERFFVFTRNRLRLELSENGEIQIRDYMNDGNLRHIKTLSGGQMFQASLAMALALSDRIQKSAGVQENFFFLDEGFGSLDRESLEIVFETLKSLRKENRIVGLISHVEEMKSQIRKFLWVENHPENGSVVWQNG